MKDDYIGGADLTIWECFDWSSLLELVRTDVIVLDPWRTEDADEKTQTRRSCCKLHLVDVLVSQGKSIADAVHAIGVTQPLGPRPPRSRRAHLGRMATSGRSTPSVGISASGWDRISMRAVSIWRSVTWLHEQMIIAQFPQCIAAPAAQARSGTTQIEFGDRR